MSPRLPQCRPKEVERALLHAGFYITHQKGSHRYYAKNGVDTSIPFHSRDVARGTLKQIIKQAGLKEDEFRALLK